MRRRYIHIILLFTVMLVAGCVKETGTSPEGTITEKVVIEATLTDQRGIQSVRVTRPVTGLNDVPEPVATATVIVSSEDSAWTFMADDSAAGYYRSEAPFLAILGKNYTLQVYVDGTLYSAKASMAQGAQFQPLQYVRDDDDTLYHVDWVASAFSTGDPAMWEVLVDWSQVPGYSGIDPEKTHARLLFYTLPTIDLSEVFAPVMEQTTFPAGSIITENRYSMTSEHAEFVRTLLLETNWAGGLFPSASSTVYTNFTEGAAGYFAVCAVTSLSLTVTGEKK